jgi:putative copper export protein
MLEVVLPPLVTAYVVFVAMVIAAVRRPAPRPLGREHRVDRFERQWLENVVATTAGGYVAFLVIVLVFHVAIAGERDAFASAVWGGGLLSIIALAPAGHDRRR